MTHFGIKSKTSVLTESAADFAIDLSFILYFSISINSSDEHIIAFVS